MARGLEAAHADAHGEPERQARDRQRTAREFAPEGVRALRGDGHRAIADQHRELDLKRQLLIAYDPAAALKRGYAILRDGQQAITSVKKLKSGQKIAIDMSDGQAQATIDKVV